MKYRLLKDLPTFKAGRLFELNHKGLFLLDNGEPIEMAYSSTTLRAFDNILEDWFVKVEDTPTRWRAKYGDSYFWFSNDGLRIDCAEEEEDKIDDSYYNFGNYFLTEEEAEQARDLFKAWRTLKDDTKGFVANLDGDRGFEVVFNYDLEILNINSYCTTGSGIRFATREDAKASTEAHRKEWLTFFGVEERE